MLPLVHEEAMLQMTARRTAGGRFATPIVVANATDADEIDAHLGEAYLPDALVILEPEARNTAPAIALAAVEAELDAILLAMPNDHVISDVAAFHAAVERSAPLIEAVRL
ncbi:sugar phosphate nucleotidyltransferase [Sphingomonas oryzagri]